jgi:uncharacterized protein (DUF924 family)
MHESDTVLDFWFGTPPGARRAEWFRKDAAFDATIRARFGTLAESALHGAIDGWQAEPLPALARVIVLDQFPRNLHRDSPRAYAGDALALQAARAIVAAGWDLGWLPVQRWFAYLPLEHAEDLAMQREAVRLFGELARQSPDDADAAEWARKHHDVIARFGRFPHRNAALGRVSTPDEVAFLAQPGSRF